MHAPPAHRPRRRATRSFAALVATLATILTIAACGSNDETTTTATPTSPTTPTATATTATTDTSTTGTATSSTGLSDTAGSASTAQASKFEKCVKDQGRDIGGLNTAVTDTGFIVDVTAANVYLFDSAATAKKKKSEVADSEDGKIEVVNNAVIGYAEIDTPEQTSKASDLIHGCL